RAPREPPQSSGDADPESTQPGQQIMLPRLIQESVARRFLVVIVCLAIAAAGVWSYTQLPVDAYPDISPQEVLIITAFPGRAPEEIERQVTIPIELAMGSVPYIDSLRSRTIFGLSGVDLIFQEGVDKDFPRQRVQERLGRVTLPQGVSPEA